MFILIIYILSQLYTNNLIISLIIHLKKKYLAFKMNIHGIEEIIQTLQSLPSNQNCFECGMQANPTIFLF